MSASGVQGWPLAGMAQTRIVAPASGMPRELKTMSSLREPCACAGATMPGHTCSASATNAHKKPIATFDRIITILPNIRSDAYPLDDSRGMLCLPTMPDDRSLTVVILLTLRDIYRANVSIARVKRP